MLFGEAGWGPLCGVGGAVKIGMGDTGCVLGFMLTVSICSTVPKTGIWLIELTDADNAPL